MTSLDPSFYVCPRCRGWLRSTSESFCCAACSARYPVVLGIPDFRVAPDPWIGIEEDRAKATRLEEISAGQSFDAMVRAYWAMTPGTPQAFADRFTNHVLSAESRTHEWIGRLPPSPAPPTDTLWLDIGCGTGDLAAAAPSTATVIGVDVAFRWLVVARRRLRESRRCAHLVCCNAERLPFRNGIFSRVLSVGTLEHVRDANEVLREARRVLLPRGTASMRTVNRYTILSEPHVGLWGVGYVPRRWADAYVRWRGGHRYLHHRPLSAPEIERGLRQAGFVRARVSPARSLLAERVHRPRLISMFAWYDRLALTPGAAWCLRWIAPLLDVTGEAG